MAESERRRQAAAWHEWIRPARRYLAVVPVYIAAVLLLNGCAGALAGLIAGVAYSVDDSDDDQVVDQPPVATFVGQPGFALCPDEIAIRYRVRNEDEGRIDVKIEVQRLEDGEPEQIALQTNVPTDTEIRFVWDAKETLDGDSAMMLALVTPFEDGASGARTERTDPFRAGNVPVSVEDLELEGILDPRSDVPTVTALNVRFRLCDRESDQVPMVDESVRVAVSIDGAAFVQVPLAPIERQRLTSAPSPGAPESFRLQLNDPRMPRELSRVAERGFAGDVVVRLSLRDFACEDWPAAPPAATAFINNNTPPRVQIVGVAESSDQSFEIPVRLVVWDEDEDPVSVLLQWAPAGEDFPDLPDFSAGQGVVSSLLGTVQTKGMLSAGGRPGNALGASGQADRYLREPGSKQLLLEDLLSNPAERQKLHLLSEAPVVVHGVVEGVLSAGETVEVRAPSFVRSGLVFRPPSQAGPRPLPAAPFGPDADVFLIGQEIEFFAPTGMPGGGTERRGSAAIAGFDPATSIAGLVDLAGPPPAAGALYELRGRTGLSGLSSLPEGVVHTYVWDSVADLSASGVPLNSRIKLRAVGVDREQGQPSFESTFDCASAFLTFDASLSLEKHSEQLAVADFNDDCRQDLVIGSSSSVEPPQLKVFVQSDGRLSSTSQKTKVLGPSGQYLVALASGDIDGDGRDDTVAVFDTSDLPDEDLIAVYRQETLADASDHPPADDSFRTPMGVVSCAIADVVGDDGRDLVVAGKAPGPRLMIYRNEGGTLKHDPEPIDAGMMGGEIKSLSVADIDGAGGNDIVVGTWYSGDDRNAVFVFFRRGGDAFEAREIANVDGMGRPGRGPPCVAVGRLDGGSVICVANKTTRTVTVFASDLELVETLDTDRDPTSLALAAVDPDDRLDVVVANGSGTIGVYLQTESGIFSRQPSFSFRLGEQASPHSVVAGDLTSDGRDDLAILWTDPVVSVYRPTGPGVVSLSEGYEVPILPGRTAASVGDVTCDGRNDAVVVNLGSTAEGRASSLTVYRQTALGVLEEALALETAPILVSTLLSGNQVLAIGDLTGDGRNDVAVANCAAGSVSVYASAHSEAADGKFDLDQTFLVQDGAGEEPLAVEMGDVNGDGRNELLVAYYRGDRVAIYRLGPAGTFLKVDEKSPGKGPNSIAAGDLNGDGKADIVVTNYGSSTAQVYYQSDAGGLRDGPSIGLRQRPLSATIADLDSDGLNDLMITLSFLGAVVYRQERNGELSDQPEDVTFTAQASAAAAGDLNGDDRNDVLLATASKSLLIFYQAQDGRLGFPCSGKYQPSQELDTVERFSSLSFGDINGDGRADVVGIAPGSGTIGGTMRVFLAR